MTHRFPIKEIALQAGLSTATVDRAINGRAHVSPQTRARVRAALVELEAQETQLSAKGRRVFFDVVVEAPERFAREIRRAVAEVLPVLGGAVVRPRFAMREVMTGPQTVAVLDRIAGRGSQGVCLKARDLPQIRAAMARLAERGIPVVTIFTDIPGPERLAYAGPDNIRAGQVAAWFVAKMVGEERGAILATTSNTSFAGEGDRFRAFSQALRQTAPGLTIHDVSGGAGLNPDTARRFSQIVKDVPDILAVYSMGGGNRAILSVLDRAGLCPKVFVAHDLDSENRALLAEGRITLVLEHDLAADMQAAFLRLLARAGLVPPLSGDAMSDVRVITPAHLQG